MRRTAGAGRWLGLGHRSISASTSASPRASAFLLGDGLEEQRRACTAFSAPAAAPRAASGSPTAPCPGPRPAGAAARGRARSGAPTWRSDQRLGHLERVAAPAPRRAPPPRARGGCPRRAAPRAGAHLVPQRGERLEGAPPSWRTRRRAAGSTFSFTSRHRHAWRPPTCPAAPRAVVVGEAHARLARAARGPGRSPPRPSRAARGRRRSTKA